MTTPQILTLSLMLLLISTICIVGFFPPTKNKESFVPRKIREMYRPIQRRVRQTSSGLYSHAAIHFTRILRKIGFI